MNWLDLLPASFGGAFALRLVEMGYSEMGSYRSNRRETRAVLQKNIEPILKSGSELFGKLRFLAQADFTPILKVDITASNLKFNNSEALRHKLSLLYLFGVFWARIEILRWEGMSFAWANTRKGEKLTEFVNCLESRAIRLVDRITQRAIAEMFIIENDGSKKAITFVEFVARYERDTEFRNWLLQLERLILELENKKIRQKILMYGVVVIALVDTLDSGHKVTKPRPVAYPNKLWNRNKSYFRTTIFSEYLPSVHTKNIVKYLG